MALNFPYPASPGDTYSYGGIIYTYDGVKWIGNIPETTVDRLTNGDKTAILNTDGTLSLDLGAKIGNVYPDQTGVDLYIPADGDATWVGINYDNQNWVYLESSFAGIEVGSMYWYFDQDGTTRFAGGYTFPNQDGTSGQVLVTDGTGSLTWQDQSGSGAGNAFTTFSVNGQEDLVASGQDTIKFVAGPGITLKTDANSIPKQIAIESKITIDNNDPNIDTEGSVWFNSELGRSFVKYDGQWVDMSPQQPINPDIKLSSITFDDGSIQTKSNDLGNLAVVFDDVLIDTASSSYINFKANGFGEQQTLALGTNESYPVRIETDWTGNTKSWKFDIDGTIELPSGGKLGGIQSSNGVELYAEGNSYVQLNYNNENAIWVDELSAVTQVGNSHWAYLHDGRMVFPDGTIQDTAYPGESFPRVPVSDFPPNSEEGTVWFNSELGRTFIKYNGQWVDTSPQTIDVRTLRTNIDDNVELPRSAIFTDGRVYQDGSNGFTSQRWVNMISPVDEEYEMLRAYRDGFSDGNEEDERGQLGLEYQSKSQNISGLYIKAFDNETESKWSFDGTGNIVLPTGAKIGAVQYPNGLDLYAGNEQYYVQLNYDNRNYVWVEPTLAGIQAGNAEWQFTEAGNISFPDGTIQTTAYTGQQSNSAVIVSDIAPTAEEGRVWFNTEEGRTYVRYNNQWVDSNPQTIDPTALRLDQDDYLNTPNNRVVLGNVNANVISANVVNSNIVNINTAVFSDNTQQTTAYLGPATLLDGGNANSTYDGNVEPAGTGGSPYNQDLNTFNNVAFNTVTSTFYGDGSHLTGIVAVSDYGNSNVASYLPVYTGNISATLYTGNGALLSHITGSNVYGPVGNAGFADTAQTAISVPAANISGLGNIAVINLDGNSSNILYGNGVFAAAPSGGGGGGTANTANTAFVGDSIYNLRGPILENADLAHGATSALIIPSNGSTSAVQLNNFYGDIVFSSSNSGAGGIQTWRFGSGNIVFPDLSVQHTAWTGTVSTSNVSGLGNIATLNLDGNASNLLTGAGTYVAIPTFDYSNTNVAAYLTANPQTGTYSNTNVASYLTSAGITNYSNTNVASYLTSVGITNYSNTNATSLMAAFGSNTITTTGNITANYFIGNGSQLTGLYSNTNVASYLSANPQTGTYSNTNVASYLTSVGITNYSNTNATSLMAAFGSNTITTTGNISSGNINTTGVYASGDVWANSGSIRTSATTANVFNVSPTTVNIAGSATIAVNIGNSSGQINLSGNVQGNTNGFAIGYRDIPQLSFSGNSTLALTDAGKHYYSTLSTANTLTIPNNASATFATGATINIINQGTGNITVAQGVGVTLYMAGNSTSANRTLTTYGVASITKVATDTWFISGVGLV